MRLQLGFIETEVGLLTIWRLPWGKRPLGTSDVQITPILMGRVLGKLVKKCGWE